MGGNNIARSPLDIYNEYCRQGKLAYQFDNAAGKAFFYPRVVGPETGSIDLEWRESAGTGRVHATTTVFRKNQEPYNVALIDMDEGFRLMSRVEDIASDSVKIGMRVRVRMHPADKEDAPYPVFVPIEEEQS